MSRTSGAPRWGSGVVVAGFIALLLSTLAAVVLAPRADAAFSTGKCAGSDIVGRGASFARDAHKVFNFNFAGNYCIGTVGFGSINVTYEPDGSGAGRNAVIERGLEPRFGMSDDPPEPFQIAQMNAGTTDPESDPILTDNGQIHVVPAAVGAVAPLVNFPDGCDVEKLPEASRTAEQNLDEDGTPDDVVRVRFNKEQFEKAWSKDPSGDEWDEVFPELSEAGCEDVPIIRVVRFDESGTTYAFKDYLNAINPATEWLAAFTANNREWPNAVFGTGGQCGAETAAPGNQDDEVDHLTSACASGNDDLTAKLVATDGSIGYSDISTARGNSPSLAIEPEANDNDTYWTQIQNGSEEFTEPTADKNGFRTDGLKGSNCQAATFNNVPGTTLEDWSKVSGVDAPSGYGICTMTYGLVFDDNADVWGSSPEEESKARTVKDYWLNALSEGAQGQLFGNDYAPLPAAIKAVSLAGINSIDWEKGEGGGGETTTPPPPATTPPAAVQPIAIVPSNRFSLLRKKINSKSGRAIVSVKLPAAGRMVLVGTAKVGKKRFRVGKVALRANKAGTFRLILKPSKAAKKWLRKRGKLRVNLQLRFIPNGGSARASKSAVTLKLKKKSGKKGKKKS